MLTDQRDKGRRAVLAEIRKAGRVARIDLARMTGISQATVTTITAELIQDGLIEEIARESDGEAKRGRPRIDLKLRGQAHLVAGVKITDRIFSIVLVDFEGEVVSEYETALGQAVFAPEALAEDLRRALREATADAGRPYETLSAVGLGLAGMVDVNAGVVHWSPSLNARNVVLQEVLEDKLRRPAFIDNDANLVAMAERYFGLGRDHSDFLVVTIEAGVGMGIVLDGKLYRGTRGCGAEFGHTKVQLDGALCRCGQRGCLEAYVADYALLREAGVGDLLQGADDQNEKLQHLMDAARAGDATAQKIIDRAARMFAMGLANLINVFDPELVILSGERMRFDFLYEDSVLDKIRGSVVDVDADPPNILIHKWGNKMWARGAAAYALDGVAEISLRDMRDNAE